MKIIDYFNDRYRRDRLVGRSGETIRVYRQQVATLERIVDRELSLEDLSNNLISDALDAILNAGKSAATANKLLRHIKAIWKHAFEAGEVDTICRVRSVREPKRVPRTWTAEQFGRVIDTARGLPATADKLGVVSIPLHVGPFPVADWWEALLLTAYYSGLRVTALLSIEWSTVDLSRGEVLVTAETQKHGSDQLIEIPSDLIAALKRIQPDRPRGRVFNWPKDRRRDTGAFNGKWQTLRSHLRRILEAAGVPSSSKYLWHGIRRYTATQAAIASGSIETAQTLLDHSSSAVTRRYVDSSQAPDRVRAADVLPAPGQPRLKVI